MRLSYKLSLGVGLSLAAALGVEAVTTVQRAVAEYETDLLNHTAQQAHFLRQSLELEIVRTLALTHDPALIEELNRTIALQRHFAEAGDFAAFMASDNDFHWQLYAAASKRELWNLVRSRSGHIDRLRRLHLPTPGKAQDIVLHHQMIVQAIETKQPEEAQQSLRKHLSGTLGYLAEIRASYPAYLRD